MKNTVCLCLVAAVIFTGSCAAAVELIVSDDAMVRSGETKVLTCRLETVEYQLCQWQKEKGSINFYSVTNPPSDIQWVDKDNARDCSIRFNKINDNFNGKWTCTVVPNVANNNPIEKSIKVTVGKLPTEVSFEPRTEKFTWRAGQETTITCKAFGSRPATVLHWYFVDGDQKTEISSKSINVTNKENVDASTFDTTSVLAYTFLPEHNGLILRCDPEHFAYLPNTTTKPTPEMSLNITFAPVHGSDPNLGTFYGYSIDEVGIITVNFSSNPLPFNNATWIVQDGTRLPVPSPSTDDPYSSSDIEVVDVAKGLFTVTLTINKVTVADTEGKHYLRVSNGMSTTEFSFRLSASAAPPPPTGVGAGVIVGIIVIILVVLVLVGLIFFARSRGMLCFSGTYEPSQQDDGPPSHHTHTQTRPTGYYKFWQEMRAPSLSVPQWLKKKSPTDAPTSSPSTTPVHAENGDPSPQDKLLAPPESTVENKTLNTVAEGRARIDDVDGEPGVGEHAKLCFADEMTKESTEQPQQNDLNK